jgi:formiminoglutamase
MWGFRINTLKPVLFHAYMRKKIMMVVYPFLISIPHGGLDIPAELEDRFALDPEEIVYYGDPDTRCLFDFRTRVQRVMDTRFSRMAVDLNRPPYALPPRHVDGAVKFVTTDKKPVYRSDLVPDITLIHQIMMRYYFPYHTDLDRVLQGGSIRIAFDCHSMLPIGPSGAKDAGRERPLICLGNNGDLKGGAKKGRLATCSAAWMGALADAFREECQLREEVTINDPFSGGFITNAHYWHTGVPFIQIEVNRALYQSEIDSPYGIESRGVAWMSNLIWRSLTHFWDEITGSGDI